MRHAGSHASQDHESNVPTSGCASADAVEAVSRERFEVPLATLTTMRVGGPAERVIEVTTKAELVDRVRDLWRSDEPSLLLGGGSNTVVSDEGFPGTVLLIRTEGIDRVADDTLPPHLVRLRVQAGHDWDALVAATVERGWSGLEALSGIPGCAGAAPIQNIGAYGAELAEVLHSIEFLDRETWEVERVAAADLGLSYRNSAIKAGRAGVVLSIDLVLEARPGEENPSSRPIHYGQLADELGVTIGERVSLKELRRAVLWLRASKGMVLDEHDRDSWSAGSFFTNPIVSERFARELPSSAPRYPVAGDEPVAAVTSLEELAQGVPMRMPQSSAPRHVKLSAAWLIEHAGIARGFRIPGSGAAISSKHTLAITNQGGATADDVAQLARFVVQRVSAEFGVLLHPEPNLYGLEV